MTEASDVWALGVIIVELLTDAHPFEGQTLDETVANIKAGRFKPLPDYVKGELKEMILSMINTDPVRRPTAEELLDSDIMQLLAKIEREKEKNKNLNEEKEKEIEKNQTLEQQKNDAEEKENIKETRVQELEEQINELNEQIIQLQLPCLVLKQIREDLKKPLEGTDEQKKELIEIQENDCKLLSRTVKDNEYDDIGIKRVTESGVVESLLFIINNRDLNSIARTYSDVFFKIIAHSNDEVNVLIYNKKPYPVLIRLLEHTDDLVASDAIASIFLLLEAGSNTIPYTDPHPHYQTIQACDGLNKIFSLYQQNGSKYSRDRSAFCIGQLFRAREISDLTMRQEIINHLKSLLSEVDDWTKEKAKEALKYLAQNEENRSVILSEIELKKIEQDLKQPIVGTEEQQQILKQKQETDLILLQLVLEGLDDDELRLQIIQYGIIESLLIIFTNRDLNSIARTYSETFIDLLNNSSDEVDLLIYSKKPYPGLIRLLEHSDDEIAFDAIASIFNILESGSDTTSDKEPHPHYQTIQESDGINKIFSLFQKNGSKYSRDISALCIGQLFRAREITDLTMRQEIINHLKSLLSDSDYRIKERTKDALKYLAQNEANRSEIMKNIDLNAISKNLQKELKGTEDEKKEIIKLQETDCLLLDSVLDEREDFQLRSDAINVGIIDVLLHIFASRNLVDITRPYIDTFFVFTHPYSFQVSKLLVDKQPFPLLLRLLDHDDEIVVSNILVSIDNILYAGAIGTQLNSQHPYYTDLASAGGIEKIFSLFKVTTNGFSKKVSAICLGIVHRAQEIKDADMRKEVIAHLKSTINDPDEETRNEIKVALKCLVQN